MSDFQEKTELSAKPFVFLKFPYKYQEVYPKENSIFWKFHIPLYTVDLILVQAKRLVQYAYLSYTGGQHLSSVKLLAISSKYDDQTAQQTNVNFEQLMGVG